MGQLIRGSYIPRISIYSMYISVLEAQLTKAR